MEGMPSQRIMTFCFLAARVGGKNSATICFLKRVLNMGIGVPIILIWIISKSAKA
jgi:hypothetical protein